MEWLPRTPFPYTNSSPHYSGSLPNENRSLLHTYVSVEIASDADYDKSRHRSGLQERQPSAPSYNPGKRCCRKRYTPQIARFRTTLDVITGDRIYHTTVPEQCICIAFHLENTAWNTACPHRDRKQWTERGLADLKARCQVGCYLESTKNTSGTTIHDPSMTCWDEVVFSSDWDG